jgi:hypothetical protein
MTEASVREEIHGESKEYARELIAKGYGYRLCICDDTAANAKLELQTKLNEFVRQVNQAAPPRERNGALLRVHADVCADTA